MDKDTRQSGALVLLPNGLDSSVSSDTFLTPEVARLVPGLSGLIAESTRGAYAFLKRFVYGESRTFRDVPLSLLNEHSSPDQTDALASAIRQKGGRWGLIADTGLPVLADPGARLVATVRRFGIPVEAHPGPSAIILALMLSGFHGQRFTFHGYFPRSLSDLKKISVLIRREVGYVHLFIETPYKTEKTLRTLLKTLPPDRTLCVAADLTLKSRSIIVKPVSRWREAECHGFGKRPAVFIMGKP